MPLAVAVITIVATSCAWPMAGHDPTGRAWEPNDHTITPDNVTRLATRDPLRFDGPNPEVIGDPDHLVVRGPNDIAVVDPHTGATEWTQTIPGLSVPALSNNALFVGGDGRPCSINRVDLTTGTILATTTIGLTPSGRAVSSCRTGAIMVVDGTAYVPWSQFIETSTSCGSYWRFVSGVTALSDHDLVKQWSHRAERAGCGLALNPRPPAVSKVGRLIVAASSFNTDVFDPSSCSAAVDSRAHLEGAGRDLRPGCGTQRSCDGDDRRESRQCGRS